MQAVLTGPIVTDYAAVVKPPWAVLALVAFLLAMVLPREVLPEFCSVSAVAALGGWVVNRYWGRNRPDEDEPHTPQV